MSETIGHYASHPLDASPLPSPRMADVAPIVHELKQALRRIRPSDNFEAGKRAGIRRALDLIKAELGEPF